MLDVKNVIKSSYSRIASKPAGGCSCSQKAKISQEIGYTAEQLQQVGEADMGLGCGNPTAFSRIKPGDIVVDLGSGGGIDCFLAAKKTGPSGKVIGIDFTEAMIAKAKANALKDGYVNVDFRLGDIENLPLPDGLVDVIISNCVINLAPDKLKVFREAYRVLKPGGMICVSDIVLLAELTAEQRSDEVLIAGCVGGAVLKDEYIAIVKQAGFEVNILHENVSISKQQYQGIPLESLLLEGVKDMVIT
ncbi:MAG TPA: arsenite S-adenosylmethyltransferase [Candidatus Kerfeldbacteria bacterium]|nr:arsenite S-adenosylmethyltransferase [Candidatus Kerfeldbacteria bacterium]